MNLEYIPRNFDYQTVLEIVTCYKSGMSGRSLATHYKIAVNTVFNILHKNGIEVRLHTLSKDEELDIISRYLDGESAYAISKRGPTNKTRKTYAKQISTQKKPIFPTLRNCRLYIIVYLYHMGKYTFKHIFILIEAQMFWAIHKRQLP